MKIKQWVGGLALGALVIVPGKQLVAQDYAQEVWSQLQSAYEIVRKNDPDYHLQNYILGHIEPSGSDTWEFSFDEGSVYILTGACDRDCKDVDILVEDSKGTVILKDDSADDTPVVRFTPKLSGRYTIRMKMHQCSAKVCYYGLGVFTK